VLKATAAEAIPVDSSGVSISANWSACWPRDRGRPWWRSMLANNETGVVQPVAEAARIAHAGGALLHCDAVQAAGKMAVDFAALGTDLMTLSAHKLGGPAGVGALIVADHVHLAAQQRGGGQERGGARDGESGGHRRLRRGAEIAAAELGAMAAIADLRDNLERRAMAAVPDAIRSGARPGACPTPVAWPCRA